MIAKNRHVRPGHIYHVLNRGACRQKIFTCDADYRAFEDLIEQTCEEIELRIFTYELMPNHWHFVVQPETKEQLSVFFQQLSGTHAKRFRHFYDSVGEGHLYQGRFKSFPVQGDGHFLTLCRYVERNALKASLVERAEDWRWGGLWRWLNRQLGFLQPHWPVTRPQDWLERVNRPLTAAELKRIRCSLRRGQPLGTQRWARDVAARLGLKHTMRRRGRPRLHDCRA